MSSSSKVRMMKLRSSDNVIFEIEEKAMSLSKTLTQSIEDVEDDDGKVIPLPNVSSQTLSRIIEYCRMHAEKDDSVEDAEVKKLREWDAQFVQFDDHIPLFDLVNAANYLDIENLQDLACQAVAEMIKDKCVEEVREIFGIENDFTEEEEAKLRSENQWAFD